MKPGHKTNILDQQDSSSSESSISQSERSILTSSTDSLDESADSELEWLASDLISESSCDSLNSDFGALTIATKVKSTTSHINKEFKVNLRETTQDNVVSFEEIEAHPGKYYVFLTKGDRLDYFQDHTSRREYVKRVIDDTAGGSVASYYSQALAAVLLKPEAEQARLRRLLKRNSLFVVDNVRSYVSPKGFSKAVARMGSGLGNPWLSLSKSSPLSTRYAEAVGYDSDDPTLHPHYNYTPRKRMLSTALTEGKLKKGWKVYWQKSGEEEFEGTIVKCSAGKKGIILLKIIGSEDGNSMTLKVDKKTGSILTQEGDNFGDASLHVLVQRPKEAGRPKHRLIGIKTVFVFEANYYSEMSKVDVEDYRNRGEIKGKCAVERENHEVILRHQVSSRHIAGRVPVLYPNLSQKTEEVYGLTGFQRSRPRAEYGDLTKNFKATHVSPKIEQTEYKLALRHAQQTNRDAELLWIDKIGTFRRVSCRTV